MSSTTTTNRLATPQRNSPSEAAISLVVRSASPGVTRPSTTTKLAKAAKTASTSSAMPATMLAARRDVVGSFRLALAVSWPLSTGVLAVPVVSV